MAQISISFQIPLNKDEIRDRYFNLTYQGSGNAMYGPRANRTEDGSFQVLVQPADVVPPSNWTRNCLPAARDILFNNKSLLRCLSEE